MRVAIIGAGFSGCHLYNILNNNDFEVTIFDKSRGTGGRLSTKYINDKFIDHGTAAITTEDKELKEFLNQKTKENILRKDANSFVPKDGMNKLCSSMIKKNNFIRNTKIIKGHYNKSRWFLLDDKGTYYKDFDILLLTNPATQILEMNININEDIKNSLKRVSYKPISTLICYNFNNDSLNLSKLEENCNFKKIINNSSKYKYRDFQSYVLHLSEEFTQENIKLEKEEIFKKVYSIIKNELNIDIKDRFETIEHLWKFALPKKIVDKDYLFDKNSNIGVCGDYFKTTNLESSYHSSKKLAKKIITLKEELTC